MKKFRVCIPGKNIVFDLVFSIKRDALLAELKTTKRPATEAWSTRDQLYLASSVLQSGDQNWTNISRSLKPYLGKEPSRLLDWTPYGCNMQYQQLTESMDSPKRTRRDSGESTSKSIAQRLVQERISEIEQSVELQREEYKVHKTDVNAFKCLSQSEDKWQKIYQTLEQEDQEAKKPPQQKKETPQVATLAVPRRTEVEVPESSEPLEEDEKKAKAGGRSPLLTSLLKSPSPTMQIQAPNSVASPTIASLLGSSPKVTTAPQQFQLQKNAELKARRIMMNPPSAERPSVGAPTLSLLLETPSAVQRTMAQVQNPAPEAEPALMLPQVPNIPVADNVAQMIDQIDVIPKELLGPEEMKHIIEDIEEFIKEDTGSPLRIPQEVPPAPPMEAKSVAQAAVQDSPQSEIAIEEIDSSSSNIAEIIGTTTVEPTEPKAPLEREPEIAPEVAEVVPEVPEPVQVPEPEPVEVAPEPEPEIQEPEPVEEKVEAKKPEEVEKPESPKPQEVESKEEVEKSAEKEVQVPETLVQEEKAEPASEVLPEVVEEKKEEAASVQEEVQELVVQEEEKPEEKEPEVVPETEVPEPEISKSEEPKPNEKEAETVEPTDEAKPVEEVVEEVKEPEESVPEEPEKSKVEEEKALVLEEPAAPKEKEKEKDVPEVVVPKVEKEEVKEKEKQEVQEERKEVQEEKKEVQEEKMEVKEDKKEEKKEPKVEVKKESESEDDELTLSKVATSKTMKTYSKKQNVAADSENENEGNEAQDYRVWKKAVMICYNYIASHKNSSLFSKPITDDTAPGYHSVVFRPMDLSTIKKNIDNGTIRTTRQFQRDMLLMFQNALMYNKQDTIIYKMAQSMQDECLDQLQV